MNTTKIKSFIFTAILIATAITISCSSDGGDDGGGKQGPPKSIVGTWESANAGDKETLEFKFSRTGVYTSETGTKTNFIYNYAYVGGEEGIEVIFLPASANTPRTFVYSGKDDFFFSTNSKFTRTGSGSEPNPNLFAGGNGTAANPWVITTAEQLWEVHYYVGEEHADKHFKLGADIALNTDENFQWTPIGINSFYTISNYFFGTFDGAGFAISGVYIDNDWDNQALFGNVGEGATIKNLGVVDVSIKGRHAGALAGWLYGSVINCYSTGNVEGSGGGLVSLMDALNGSNASIANSYSTANVRGQSGLGGLVGQNGGKGISNSYATGNVQATGSPGSNSGSIGGLVGTNNGPIINSYATGDVQGENGVGGLAGTNSGSITNSYSTGSVTKTSTGDPLMDNFTNVGGLTSTGNGTVSNSYYDSETSGQSDTGRGTPKTTEEMKTQSTYTGWNFTNIWGIDSETNDGYPFLQENKQ